MKKFELSDLAPDKFGSVNKDTQILSPDYVLSTFNHVISSVYDIGSGLSINTDNDKQTISVAICPSSDNIISIDTTGLYAVANIENKADKSLVATTTIPIEGISVINIDEGTAYGRSIATYINDDNIATVVLSYTNGSIYVSKDNGQSFLSSAQIATYARDITYSNGYFYIVNKSYLYKASINDLTTWTQLPAIPTGDGRYLYNTTNNTLYVCGDSSIYYLSNDTLIELSSLTTDAHWNNYKATAITEIDNILYAYSVYNSKATGAYVYRSTDNGQTWTFTLLDESLSNGLAGIVKFKNQIIAIVSEYSDKAVNDFISIDNGITWKTASYIRTKSGYSSCVLVSPDKQSLIVAVNNGSDNDYSYYTQDLINWNYLLVNDQPIKSWKIVPINDNGIIACAGITGYQYISVFNKMFKKAKLEDLNYITKDSTPEDLIDNVNYILAILKDMNIKK